MLVLTWLNPALQGGQPSLLYSPKLHVPQGKPGPPIALNIYQVPDILGSLSWRCFKGTPGAVASFSFWNLSTLSVEQERLGHMQGKVRL